MNSKSTNLPALFVAPILLVSLFFLLLGGTVTKEAYIPRHSDNFDGSVPKSPPPPPGALSQDLHAYEHVLKPLGLDSNAGLVWGVLAIPAAFGCLLALIYVQRKREPSLEVIFCLLLLQAPWVAACFAVAVLALPKVITP